MSEMKLYDYSASYQNVLNMIDDDDIKYEDVKDTLDAIQDGSEEKIANTGKLIQKLKDDLEIIKIHEKRIKELKYKKQKNIDNLIDYLLIHMNLLDKKKVETPTITVSKRETKRMIITNEEKLPDKFLKVKVNKTVDKEGFKKYFKNLSEEEASKIDYAHLETNQSITIK
ncbi:siphovirus Gp157 family protein [Staphylococcus hyicus]|uniref:siphovirus Gp157 family protein n=1 Tax=Staphylococcus hyicus TaxID=1284 RepID=UPI002365C260|nr:siphovirus Gp157 family protein [Staphylococcus hyicus]